MTTECAEPMTEMARAATTPFVRLSRYEPVRLLVVEDNPEAVELIKAYLTSAPEEPFDLESTNNLREAMFRLQLPGVDAVLLDLGLPELSGYKTFRVIEAMTDGRVPIVIFTADDRPISRDLTLSCGASDYLIKQDTSAAELRQAIRNAVAHFRHTTLI